MRDSLPHSHRLHAWHNRLIHVRRLALAICLAICTTAVVAAQQLSDESLARIRERLQHLPALAVEFPGADFSIYIEGKRPLEDVFAQPPWVPMPDEFAAPGHFVRGFVNPGLAVQPQAGGGSVDPGLIAHAISQSIRAHAARGEVKRAIAEYCIAHREEAGADKICGQAH